MNVSQLVYMFLVNEGINKNGRREGGRESTQEWNWRSKTKKNSNPVKIPVAMYMYGVKRTAAAFCQFSKMHRSHESYSEQRLKLTLFLVCVYMCTCTPATLLH